MKNKLSGIFLYLALAWGVFCIQSAISQQWKSICGKDINNFQECDVKKFQDIQLGGVAGYVVQYKRESSIAQWWIPDGTGTCWYKNTFFKENNGEWTPVNAYCDGEGRVILRRIDGTILFTMGLDG